MELELTLALPRDQKTVPIARGICTHALASLDVADDCAHDIEVALTEACTNVLDHAGDGEEYDVCIAIDDRVCVIEVVDQGRGFDPDGHTGGVMVRPDAERGRGIKIMQALVDRVQFTTLPGKGGTVCRLEKELVWPSDAPVRQLAETHPDAAE